MWRSFPSQAKSRSDPSQELGEETLCRATHSSQNLGLPLTSAPSSLKLANEDKEQKLALLEEARVAMGKEAGELRAGLQEVERSRLEARRELQELRRQVPSPALHPPWTLAVCPWANSTPFWSQGSPVYKTGGLN